MNYLDIVVHATLSLTNSSENIGLKAEKLSTEVKSNYFNLLLAKQIDFIIVP